MRRVLGYGLVAVGVAVTVFALALRFYAVPRLKKMPPDTSEVLRLEGTGRYFSREVLRLRGPVPMMVVRTLRADPDATTEEIAVVDTFSSTTDLSNQGVIEASEARVVLNRDSALPDHCCGEEPRHEGYVLKLPFDTERTTYPVWDSTAGRAFPARFVRAEVVEGLEVYVFEQRIKPVEIDRLEVPGGILGREREDETVEGSVMYEGTRAVSVEPLTGGIINVSIDTRRWFEPDDGTERLTLADVNLDYNSATVQDRLEAVGSSEERLKLLQDTAPLAGIIAGPLLVVGGALLLRRSSRA